MLSRAQCSQCSGTAVVMHGALDLERLRVLRDDDELDVVLVRDRVLVDAVDADAVLGTDGTKAGNDAVGVLHGASGCGAPLVCSGRTSDSLHPEVKRT